MKPYAVLALLALTLSACGANESEPQAVPSPMSEASTPTPPESTKQQSKQTEGPVYYGTWTVQGAVAATAVATAPEDSFTGNRTTYSEEEASFGEERVQNPEYVEKEFSEAEFVSEFRTPPSALGLANGTVRIVEVADWSSPGSTIIVKDEDTLFFLWDGNYYEMKRES